MCKKIYLIIFITFFSINYLFSTMPAFRTEGYEVLKTKLLTVEGGSSIPVVFDWDGDNKKDLIISSAYRKIYIYFNQGSDSSPSFNKATPLLKNGSEAHFLGQLVTCFISSNSDMNGDNKPDFLLCIDGKVSVYTNITRDRNNPSINKSPIELTFGPAFSDHIGDDDVLVNFVGHPYYTAEKNIGWPVVLDYNNDTKPDILSTYFIQLNQGLTNIPLVRIAIYTNGGSLTSPSYNYPMISVIVGASPYAEPNTPGSGYPYAFPVDWNKDGTNDIILAYTAPGIEVVQLGSEAEYSVINFLRGTSVPGIFDKSFSPLFNAVTSKPFNLGWRIVPFVCDWDNDNNWDIVAGDYLGNVHIIKKGLTDQLVQVNTSIGCQGALLQNEDCDLFLGRAASMSILDWNGNGKYDIFASSGGYRIGNGMNYIFINYGDNNTPLYKGYIIQDELGRNIIRAGGASGQADTRSFSTIYDLNKDGKKDLILGGEYFIAIPKLVFYKNIGTDNSPIFSTNGIAIKSEEGNIEIYNVAAKFSDMNFDGYDDLILTGADAKVRYCLNLKKTNADGLPSYGSIEYLTVGLEKDAIVTGDIPSIINILDWDKENGIRDIVAAAGSKIVYFLDTSKTSVPYYEKMEEIKFEREILNAGDYSSVEIFDWDNDGYYDIFLSNSTDKIYKYKGMQLRYVGENDDLLPKESVYTFPNPLRKSDNLNFKFLTRDDALITIEIYTIKGKLIDRINTNAYFDEINIHAIICKKFANGIYIFRITAKSYITGEEESVTKRFAILR